MPLVESWFYGWLGVPDDRLVGVVAVLFYLALTGVCYTAVRRQGGTWEFALGASVVVASIPHVVGLSGLVFADVPLAVFVTIAAVYLVEWLDDGRPARLAIAALAAGLMPWTKREGIVLVAVLCLATLLIGRELAVRGSVRVPFLLPASCYPARGGHSLLGVVSQTAITCPSRWRRSGQL